MSSGNMISIVGGDYLPDGKRQRTFLKINNVALVVLRLLLMTLAPKCFQRLRLFYSQRDGSLMLSTFRSSCTFTLSIRTPEVIR